MRARMRTRSGTLTSSHPATTTRRQGPSHPSLSVTAKSPPTGRSIPGQHRNADKVNPLNARFFLPDAYWPPAPQHPQDRSAATLFIRAIYTVDRRYGGVAADCLVNGSIVEIELVRNLCWLSGPLLGCRRSPQSVRLRNGGRCEPWRLGMRHLDVQKVRHLALKTTGRTRRLANTHPDEREDCSAFEAAAQGPCPRTRN